MTRFFAALRMTILFIMPDVEMAFRNLSCRSSTLILSDNGIGKKL
jgi:hypothetical protein